jgi:hypothetical protein
MIYSKVHDPYKVLLLIDEIYIEVLLKVISAINLRPSLSPSTSPSVVILALRPLELLSLSILGFLYFIEVANADELDAECA